MGPRKHIITAPQIKTDEPADSPRDFIRPQTAIQGLAEYSAMQHKRWDSWTARQRVAVIAMLLQLIWPVYIYTIAHQSPYTAQGWTTMITIVATMYVPAMVALGAAWLFFKPNKWSH